jgi:hypothetical protein
MLAVPQPPAPDGALKKRPPLVSAFIKVVPPCEILIEGLPTPFVGVVTVISFTVLNTVAAVKVWVAVQVLALARFMSNSISGLDNVTVKVELGVVIVRSPVNVLSEVTVVIVTFLKIEI